MYPIQGLWDVKPGGVVRGRGTDDRFCDAYETKT